MRYKVFSSELAGNKVDVVSFSHDNSSDGLYITFKDGSMVQIHIIPAIPSGFCENDAEKLALTNMQAAVKWLNTLLGHLEGTAVVKESGVWGVAEDGLGFITKPD